MNVKTVLENVNAIKEIADSMQNLDLKEKIVDLKEQVIELREENINLKEELNKKNQLNMVFEKNTYWNINHTDKKDGPFCSACWDNNSKSVRMQRRDDGFARCPVCKNTAWT